MTSLNSGGVAAFRRTVWMHYRKHGRHDLPWRKTTDSYRILVSEVMLQQTQVDRVGPFYTEFIRTFPTAKKLAAAPLAEVLKCWQGLGYNRRAKMLHATAKELAAVPRSNLGTLGSADLEKLPGVGPYTARAVAAFAWNEPVIMVETNIRTVIIHHFFPERKKVSDAEIASVLENVLPKGRAREWYWALMDYGASLKRSGVSHNARSKTYVKQTAFSGSRRQARGAILRELAQGAKSGTRLSGLLGDERRAQVRTALDALVKERLVVRIGRQYELAQ